MSARAAILIGVARAGRLPQLAGALNDVTRFGDWAEKQGYEVDLITDEKDDVTVDRIKDVITRVLGAGDVERMILYFAGHGIQPTVNTAYWLLSNWDEDSDEAVNVSLSLANAKRSGIFQIAVFADACRSTAPDAASVGGRSIFPKPSVVGPKQPQWDQFFAARLSESALDVGNADPTKSYGVFSKCVLSALSGEAQDAIADRPGAAPGRAVTSDSLATYLEDALPRESGRIPGGSVQIPEVIAGWRHPDDVYIGLGDAREPRGSQAMLSGLPPDARQAAATRDEAFVNAASRLFGTAAARESFETGQGLTIVGATATRVVVSKSTSADLFQENNAWHVRGRANAAQSAVIELADGSWLATAIIPGFVGAILVQDGTAASLTYTPARSGRFSSDDVPYPAVTPLVYRWTALMHRGRSFQDKELRAAAEQLRRYKHSNPSLGVLAAYAYERIGDIAEIDDLTQHFARRDQPIPFDVAYLSRNTMHYGAKPSAEVAGPLGPRAPVAGGFPLMTQGWALLDPDDGALHRELFRVCRHLRPSLWTTLERDGGQALAALVHEEAV